jgi:hypothetical protein
VVGARERYDDVFPAWMDGMGVTGRGGDARADWLVEISFHEHDYDEMIAWGARW